MKNRTDAFNTGSYAQDQTAEPMDHVSNWSEIRSANKKGHRRGTDGLYNALSAPSEMYRATRKADLPTDNHHWSHSKISEPRGALYHPAGQFGRTKATGVGSTRQIYGPNRHSAKPSNAVPGHQNSRDGENAVGYAPNRRGSNAVPGHQNTDRGQNGVPGNQRRGVGENALASRFVPRGGFHGGARRA